MWTIEETRERYRTFDDSKIRELAQNPRGLRKEIVSVLTEEVKRRNLDVKMIEWIEHETNSFEGLERQNLVRKIARSKCSNCSQKSDLSGYRFTTVISFIIMISNKTENLIICRDCAKSKRFSSMITTILFGWFSKKGIFYAPYSFISDLMKIFKTESENEKVIDSFIENNTGALRIALEKGNELNDILAEFNNLNK